MNNLSNQSILIVVVILLAMCIFYSMSRSGCRCGYRCGCGCRRGGRCRCPYMQRMMQ